MQEMAHQSCEEVEEEQSRHLPRLQLEEDQIPLQREVGGWYYQQQLTEIWNTPHAKR